MTVYHHLYFAPPIAAFDAVLRWIDWPRFLSSCIAARSKSHEAMANGLEGVQQDIMKTKGDIASHKAQLDAVKAELKTAQDNQIRTLLWEQLLALQEQITAMYQQLTSLLEIRNLLEGQGLPDYNQRFVDLLSLGSITRPDPAVLSAIRMRCPARLMVAPDCAAAVDLYREAQLWPGPSTRGHLFTQHGLRVNEPLFSNPGEGSPSLQIATTREGRPVVLKMLAGGVSADSGQQPGGAEAEACRALTESKPEDVPLVPASIVTFKLSDEHKSTAGRGPGLHAAVCMPRYVTSLEGMVPLAPLAVLAGARRMATALAWVHDKGYTHMDVKADNILVDMDGRWWLGDFGSTVRTGSSVSSTTTCFAPGHVLGLPAKPEYDWHMLAVALVYGVNKRETWRQVLVKDGCAPAEKLIAAVSELHGREGCKELACFLDELLQRAGYTAAQP